MRVLHVISMLGMGGAPAIALRLMELQKLHGGFELGLCVLGGPDSFYAAQNLPVKPVYMNYNLRLGDIQYD